MRRASRPYPHAELLAELTREGLQFGLASLHESAGQVPHVRARTLARPPMYEQHSTFPNQRADHHLMHSQITARTSDSDPQPWNPRARLAGDCMTPT